MWWDAAPRTLRPEDLTLVLEAIPRRFDQLVAVLDYASLHRSRVVREALPRRSSRAFACTTCRPTARS